MIADQRGHYFSIFGYGPDGGNIICAHEATVALDVGAKDSAEFAFYALLCHNKIALF
jgi:hypothetical protein